MGSNTVARLLLAVGFLAASIAYDAWIVSHVVLNPNTTRSAATALLDAPAVRQSLADQLQSEITQQIPAIGGDPRVGPALDQALRDPRVDAAFADTLAQIHQAVLSDSGAQTFTIDGHALTNALHDEIAPSNPQLAAEILRAPPLAVSISSKNLPHVHDARPTANVITLLAAMAALLLITASLLLRHDHRAVRRVGRRIAFVAAAPIVVLVLLPRVLAHASGDAPQIAAALLRVYGNRVLPSAIALVAGGLAVFVGAIVWPRHSTRMGNSTRMGRSGPERAPSYTGPVPTRSGPPDRPDNTDKLYL